jgi:6-pyruvoyltetrahydropterin/6-carboxytetrahydropterin synthase
MNLKGSAKKPVRMARRISFSSAHLYHQSKWSEEKNRAIFGPCFSQYGHGHNYTFEVFFMGEVDSQTGLIANLSDVQKVLKEIVAPLDHQHLNFALPAFKNLVPTTENIASFLLEKAKEHFASFKMMEIYKIRLFETEDLWVEINV